MLWRLISGFHVVIGKLIKAVRQGSPGIIFRNKEDYIPELFDINVAPREAEFLGKSDGLASPVYKDLGGLHNDSPFAIKYISIY